MTVRVARTSAPAKINLALHIGPRRPDGFHQLLTVFQAISLSDDVEVTVTPGLGDDSIALHVDGPDLGPVEDNLAWRAARAAREVTDVRGHISIRLVKRIPAGAGLGGGSSDAAAVLRCLAALGGVEADPALPEIGGELGSDVPFFLGPSATAVGRGRGEQLEPLEPLPARDVVLALPHVHVSTVEAYGALARARADLPAPDLPEVPAETSWSGLLGGFARNDFEPLISELYPEIGASLKGLWGGGADVAMLSGSGAACFAFFPAASMGAERADALSGTLGWPFRVERTLTEMPAVVVEG